MTWHEELLFIPMSSSLFLLALLLVAPAHAALLGRLLGKKPSVPQPTPLDATIQPKDCMGTWYVQHQVPALAFLEGGARNGMELYEWNSEADGGDFSVRYTFNRKDAAPDAITTVRQRGWVASDKGTSWKVAPWLGKFYAPVRLPFIMLDVDPAKYMVCTGGLKSWMYLMTRERQPDAAVLDACLATVEAAGFDMSKVMRMEQDATQ